MPPVNLFTGKTLEDAVTKGLEALGLSRAEAMITVIEEGSSGFLGLGSRPYRVRVMPRPGGAIREREEQGAREGRSRRERTSRGGREGRQARGRREGRGGATAESSRGESRPEGRSERRPEGRGERRPEGRGERRSNGRSDRRERFEERRMGERRSSGADAGAAPTTAARPPAPIVASEAPPRSGTPAPQGEWRRENHREERRAGAYPPPAESDTRSSAPPPREGWVEESGEGGGRRRRRRGRRGGRGRGGAGRGAERIESGAPEELSVAAPQAPAGIAEPWAEPPIEEQPVMMEEPQGAPEPPAAHLTPEPRGPVGEPARDSAAPTGPNETLAAEGKRWTEQLLRAMGFEAKVSASADGDRVDVAAEVAAHDELLTGPKGEVRQALQHLLNRMINRGEGSRYHLQLEINDFWKRREEELERLARQLADEALAKGSEAVTEYLNAQERRIIHVALRGDTRVRTYALGDGMIKRLAVAPAEAQGGERAE
jgi:spoIIIJ-associated protein